MALCVYFDPYQRKHHQLLCNNRQDAVSWVGSDMKIRMVKCDRFLEDKLQHMAYMTPSFEDQEAFNADLFANYKEPELSIMTWASEYEEWCRSRT